MKKEDKELLLKDLCSRLPYGVKIRIEYPFLKEEEWHSEILYGLDLQRLCIANTSIRLEEFKPYLFPLSSMTKEQREELRSLLKPSVLKSLDEDESIEFPTLISANPSVIEIDFYNKYHFDYRGLIPMGLAIDATGLNIYKEEKK